jgi:hypothetical protein
MVRYHKLKALARFLALALVAPLFLAAGFATTYTFSGGFILDMETETITLPDGRYVVSIDGGANWTPLSSPSLARLIGGRPINLAVALAPPSGSVPVGVFTPSLFIDRRPAAPNLTIRYVDGPDGITRFFADLPATAPTGLELMAAVGTDAPDLFPVLGIPVLADESQRVSVYINHHTRMFNGVANGMIVPNSAARTYTLAYRSAPNVRVDYARELIPYMPNLMVYDNSSATWVAVNPAGIDITMWLHPTPSTLQFMLASSGTSVRSAVRELTLLPRRAPPQEEHIRGVIHFDTRAGTFRCSDTELQFRFRLITENSTGTIIEGPWGAWGNLPARPQINAEFQVRSRPSNTHAASLPADIDLNLFRPPPSPSPTPAPTP